MRRLALLTGAALAGRRGMPWPMLQAIDGYDSTGDGLTVLPSFTDGTVRRVFVNPNATKFTLSLECAPHQKLLVNGVEESGEVTLRRDRSKHSQVVEAVCHSRDVASSEDADKQRYVFLVQSDHSEIATPHLFMNQVGADCEVKASALSGAGSYQCADPKLPGKMVSLTPSNLLDDVQYTLAANDGSVELRLLNNIPTVLFNYDRSFKLRAVAGQLEREWSVSFGGNLISNLLYGVGCFLAVCLLTLVASLIAVIGASSWLGPGVPIDTTEVASLLAMTIQYFAIANKLRGSSSLESIATPLKWVSMFWPAPVTISRSEDPTPLSGAGPTYSRAYGVSFGSELDSSAVGDVSDLNNATGCIMWAALLLGTLLVIHQLMIFYARMGASNGYTVPHRFALGNWESRAANLMTLPLAAAAALGLLHPHRDGLSIALAIVTLIALVGWMVQVFTRVSSAVNGGDVTWVWETSVRETGPSRSKEMAGYWCDTECDQLLSVPVNRAIAGGLFEYRWVNTVADIEPVILHDSGSTSRGGSSSRGSASRGGGSSSHNPSSSASGQSMFSAAVVPTTKMRNAHRAPQYLLAKTPQVVSVEQSRKPCAWLNGSQLMAGVLRTKWLDIMFTFEGLMRFFEYEMVDGSDTCLPLLVKTSQLSGPITSGANAYFFDGVRVPFVRIAETSWKIFVGLALGVAAAAAMHDSDSAVPTMCYALVAALSLAMGVYVLSTQPYSRRLDTFSVASVAALVAGSAGAMTLYAYNRKSALADVFLSLNILAALGLGLYAIYMIVSVFTAVCCPPLNESRFLEKLANCSVYVAPPVAGDAATNYQLPGYTKYAAKDLVAKSTSGRAKIHTFGTFEDLDLYFTHEELAGACTSGVLPIP